jgi:hypothetical protein
MQQWADGSHIPFAKTCVQVDDGLATLDISKSNGIGMKHFVGNIWEEASDVDIGNSFAVLRGKAAKLTDPHQHG